MKKVILLIIPILLLCGCETKEDKDYKTNQNNFYFVTYVDEETCVEYFVSEGYYNRGNVSVKYNTDGTIKLNKECKIKKELK